MDKHKMRRLFLIAVSFLLVGGLLVFGSLQETTALGPVKGWPTPPPEEEPGVEILFEADSEEIEPGECTTLRWEVRPEDAVQRVLGYEAGEPGEGVELESAGQVEACPDTTATYILKVYTAHGLIERSVTIHVHVLSKEKPPTPTPPIVTDPYADRVVSFTPGSPWNSDFGNTNSALGPPDFNESALTGFLTLGMGGSVTVEFVDNVAVDGPGPDIEILGDPANEEQWIAEVSAEGVSYKSFGKVRERATLDLATVGLASARFVRLTDDGDLSLGPSPGAELDAVEAMNSAAPGAPLPPPPLCTPDAAFVADVTIPDYTTVQAGGKFDKTWRLKNTGTCLWDAGYRLAFVSGEKMGAPDSQAVPSTPSGGVADITVPMYAPASPGTYEGRWRMVNPNNTPFGQEVVVIIQVPAAAPPPGPQPPAPPPPPGCPGPPVITSFTANPSTITAGGSSTLSWGLVSNATSAVIDQGIGGVGTPGSIVVKPTQTTTYIITATGCGGTATKQVTIVVNPPGPQPGPPPPPNTVDLAVTDLYPDKLPQGRMYVRITNNGPASLTNASVTLTCTEGRTPVGGGPPSASTSSGPITLSLNPGQTAAFDTGISVDTNSFSYNVTCEIGQPQGFSDPNMSNNKYSEDFLPSIPKADLAVTDLYPDNMPKGEVYTRITNNGPASLTNVGVQLSCSAVETNYITGAKTTWANEYTTPITLSLNPGQTQVFDTRVLIDTTNGWFDFKCTVKVDFNDPNTNNNTYSETFPPPP